MNTYAPASEELTIQASAINAEMNVGQMSVVKTLDPTFYYHNDLVGTPKIMTNSGGMEVWKSDLAPYGERFENEFVVGNLNAEATNSNLNINLRFPGQYADTETGFNYNYFRDYDPSTGRYIQSDPIGLRGGLNTYGYVGGDPINQADPKGLCPWCVGGAVGFFTGAILEYKTNDNATWTSALEQGIVVGAAGAASAGASLLPAIAIAVSATSAKESYDSYQECGDLSKFDGNSVLASGVGTLFGGSAGKIINKTFQNKYKINGVDTFFGRLSTRPLKGTSRAEVYSPNIEFAGITASVIVENSAAAITLDAISN